jgi:hypothetical protein
MTEPIEPRLQALAKEFQYPPTPSVTDAVMTRLRAPVTLPRRNRQLAWALTLLIVVLAGLMSVPPVRAAVLEFIQIGLSASSLHRPPVPKLKCPYSHTCSNSSFEPLLEKLRRNDSQRANNRLPIPLPTYPAELGLPDQFFFKTQAAGCSSSSGLTRSNLIKFK